MELKITEIALYRSKTHTGERTTDKGVQIGIFFIENLLVFLNWCRNRFLPIQILKISPLHNGRRDAQITTLTQRSRPISLIELGVPVVFLTKNTTSRAQLLILKSAKVNINFKEWKKFPLDNRQPSKLPHLPPPPPPPLQRTTDMMI